MPIFAPNPLLQGLVNSSQTVDPAEGPQSRRQKGVEQELWQASQDVKKRCRKSLRQDRPPRTTPPTHARMEPLPRQLKAKLSNPADLTGATGLVFPSPTGKPLSNSTISKLVRENGINAVPHGMRSSFRDWCRDSGVPREIAEAALAHTVGGVEGAYARSDLLEARRPIMEQWAHYLERPMNRSLMAGQDSFGIS